MKNIQKQTQSNTQIHDNESVLFIRSDIHDHMTKDSGR